MPRTSVKIGPHISFPRKNIGEDRKNGGGGTPYRGERCSHTSFGRPHLGFHGHHACPDALKLGADALYIGEDALKTGEDAPCIGEDPPHLGEDALHPGPDALNPGGDAMNVG